MPPKSKGPKLASVPGSSQKRLASVNTGRKSVRAKHTPTPTPEPKQAGLEKFGFVPKTTPGRKRRRISSGKSEAEDGDGEESDKEGDKEAGNEGEEEGRVVQETQFAGLTQSLGWGSESDEDLEDQAGSSRLMKALFSPKKARANDMKNVVGVTEERSETSLHADQTPQQLGTRVEKGSRATTPIRRSPRRLLERDVGSAPSVSPQDNTQRQRARPTEDIPEQEAVRPEKRSRTSTPKRLSPRRLLERDIDRTPSPSLQANGTFPTNENRKVQARDPRSLFSPNASQLLSGHSDARVFEDLEMSRGEHIVPVDKISEEQKSGTRRGPFLTTPSRQLLRTEVHSPPSPSLRAHSNGSLTRTSPSPSTPRRSIPRSAIIKSSQWYENEDTQLHFDEVDTASSQLHQTPNISPGRTTVLEPSTMPTTPETQNHPSQRNESVRMSKSQPAQTAGTTSAKKRSTPLFFSTPRKRDTQPEYFDQDEDEDMIFDLGTPVTKPATQAFNFNDPSKGTSLPPFSNKSTRGGTPECRYGSPSQHNQHFLSSPTKHSGQTPIARNETQSDQESSSPLRIHHASHLKTQDICSTQDIFRTPSTYSGPQFTFPNPSDSSTESEADDQDENPDIYAEFCPVKTQQFPQSMLVRGETPPSPIDGSQDVNEPIFGEKSQDEFVLPPLPVHKRKDSFDHTPEVFPSNTSQLLPDTLMESFPLPEASTMATDSCDETQ